MIFRARTVVTMDGAPIEDGGVITTGNKITAVGKFNEVKTHHSGPVCDLGEQILLPGLINAHCHLDYTCLRGRIRPQNSFADWIRAINAEKAKLSAQDYVESIRAGFSEAKDFGTTTIANLTGFPELVREIELTIRTWWFAELIDVRDPQKAEALVESAVESLRSTKNWGLGPHAPFTASPQLYRRCEEIARRKQVLLTTHLAESAEEMQMSLHRRGALRDLLESMGVALFESEGVTPVREVTRRCAADERWLLVHLNSVSDADIALLAQRSSKCHVVHCPRSHHFFGHEPFRFSDFQGRGFNICLGTDSLASNDDLSLFREMRAFHRQHPNVPSQRIVEMVTVNPAQALGQGNNLGKIRAGFYADLITIPHENGSDVSDQIIAFDQKVLWGMIDGAPF